MPMQNMRAANARVLAGFRRRFMKERASLDATSMGEIANALRTSGFEAQKRVAYNFFNLHFRNLFATYFPTQRAKRELLGRIVLPGKGKQIPPAKEIARAFGGVENAINELRDIEREVRLLEDCVKKARYAGRKVYANVSGMENVNLAGHLFNNTLTYPKIMLRTAIEGLEKARK